WRVVTNHNHSLLGRIWIMWNPVEVQFTVGDISQQAIHGKLVMQGAVINVPVVSKSMRDLGECIKKCEVEDLRQIGLFYSWSNKRTGAGAVAKKIDRVMGNWGWFKVYGQVQALFLPPGISDHSPCILQFRKPSFTGSRPFKYLNVWASHPSFLEVVKQVWAQPVVASPLDAIGMKLRLLKRALKEFHSTHFKDLETECTRLRLLIETQQALLDVNPANAEARNQEKKLMEEYYEASRKEEIYFKQKARINWLKLGDSNSKYFHKVVRVRQARNSIVKIQKSDGEWTQSQQEVGEESVQFFSDLLRGQIRRSGMQLKNFGVRITGDQKEAMGMEVSRKEIEEALWSQNLDKAPGPDGYNGRFFKDAWSIVGDEVILAIKSFFMTDSLPRGTNSTILCLIPKVASPSSLKDFRPIACCNFLYKTIS
ncbi:hypothetical protein CFOL_v3_35852, partial [Cephalotus follicularis]